MKRRRLQPLRTGRQPQTLPPHQSGGSAQTGRGQVKPLALLVKAPQHRILQAPRRAVDRAQPDLARLRHQFGRRRGRRRPQIGDEIGDGEVGLVPDTADDGHRALHQHACQ